MKTNNDSTNMPLFYIFFILLFSPTVISVTEDSINLLVRSSVNSTVRRYCVELAKLPNDHTVDIPSFGWHDLYIAPPSVNACNTSNLAESLPPSFPPHTLLILTEHQCKMTEHAWHVEERYGDNIALMILSNRTNTHYELTYNTSAMPVAIPVLVFWQNDFNRLNQTYQNLTTIQFSISYPLEMPRKFRPATLLMFALVLFILLGGNFWAADEFVRKIQNRGKEIGDISTTSNTTTPMLNDHQDSPTSHTSEQPIVPTTNTNTQRNKVEPTNNEPAVLYMPYCMIAVMLCFAVGWLLLIFYFPKVMIYVLQVMFCIGAFSSMTSCLDRLSYFVPITRRFRIPSHTCHKPCTCQLGPLNVFTLCALIVSLAIVLTWYVNRQADWAWILQDILGTAVCLTVISVYRLGNMRVITLILLGFFLYDIFFVFITPFIPFFQPTDSSTSTTTATTTTTTTVRTQFSYTNTQTMGTRRLSRNPSVMEQVALGIGADGEVVPLLFVLPMFIPDSEIDPCVTIRKSMLGFGDVILPGILLTFCKIFDIAMGNRWPIYYIQSVISYFIGLVLTHLALYLMNTAQPALLYLVPCILLSTILTGLCRGELKELYTGRRIQALKNDQPKDPNTTLLANSDTSINEQQTDQSHDVVIGISDAIGTAVGVENR